MASWYKINTDVSLYKDDSIELRAAAAAAKQDLQLANFFWFGSKTSRQCGLQA